MINAKSRYFKSIAADFLIKLFLFQVHPSAKKDWRLNWKSPERLFGSNLDIGDSILPGSRFSAIWEVLCQRRGLEWMRIIHPILARAPMSNPDYALNYSCRKRCRS